MSTRVMKPIRGLIDEYEWVHTGIGLVGNVLFVVGSALFMAGVATTISGAVFIGGSTLMFVGTTGRLLVDLERRRRARHDAGRRTAALSGS